MADESSKMTQNQSIHDTVLQVLNAPHGETMTPQMLLSLVGLLDLAGILDYLQGNSPGLPLVLNSGQEPDKFRAAPQAANPAQDPTASNNAALLNTLMSLVGNKNGKINPSVLPLLINMLSAKASDPPAPPKQESPPEDKEA